MRPVSEGVAVAASMALLLSFATILAPEAQAQPPSDAQPVDEIVVFGRGLEMIGGAGAASEGTVSGADLAVRPLLRVAEVLEAVPGFIAAQHSGTGKANQYFLRGFNLDHGTDFSVIVDGVPWNLRTHGHGQGYLDVNGLLPEIIDRLQFRKGTYFADTGDFSMAGSARIRTVDRFDAPFLAAEAGVYGFGRIAGGGTAEFDEGLLTLFGEARTYDGPWDLAEDLGHYGIWGKYVRPTNFGQLSLTWSGLHADWRPTEQIPERVIGSDICADRFCVLDPTATGETSRWITAALLQGDAWDASAYLQYYDWRMLSNPTYDEQIDQFDRRWTAGGSYRRYLVETLNLDVSVGTDFRHDAIGKVGLDHTEQAEFVDNISSNAVDQTSLGAFAEATFRPTDRLRLMAGVRGDIYRFDVTANTPQSFAGRETDSRVSPKLGAAYQLSRRVEFYGNWGRGFHSNDARGVVNEAEPVPGLVKGTGYEVGARYEIGALRLTTTYWWLDSDSELLFEGDTNSVEPMGASNRRGYELVAFWRPLPWLGLDAVYAGSRARFVDDEDGEGRYIDGAVEKAGSLGLAAVRGPWEASFRVRYLGGYPLVSDNSRRAGSETTLNLRGAYALSSRATVYAELLNALDRKGRDIVYWYESWVDGFDPPGLTADDMNCDVVNCRMSRAMEPRTLRAGIRFTF
jgi:outer membrane receptor protein involved in Fe transport